MIMQTMMISSDCYDRHILNVDDHDDHNDHDHHDYYNDNSATDDVGDSNDWKNGGLPTSWSALLTEQ